MNEPNLFLEIATAFSIFTAFYAVLYFVFALAA